MNILLLYTVTINTRYSLMGQLDGTPVKLRLIIQILDVTLIWDFYRLKEDQSSSIYGQFSVVVVNSFRVTAVLVQMFCIFSHGQPEHSVQNLEKS